MSNLYNYNTLLTAFTTLSTVKPNFSKRTLAGAEAPKLFMAIVVPSRPTYLPHPVR